MVADDSPSVYDLIDRSATAAHSGLVAARHHLHSNPELSNREVKTSAFVANRLREIGIDDVRTGIAGHGVVGVLRGGLPGERVAGLRADMDALPVREDSGVDFASQVVDDDYPGGPFPVAHSCGHDCHTATVLAAAEVLSSVRDQLPGTVLFAFQPAEEGPPADETGGAQAMLDAGAFADPTPTMMFGMHVTPIPLGFVGYREGNQYAASCLVKIRVTGKQVHGSTPWLGVDPMPAVGSIAVAIGQLYRQVPATNAVTVSVGHIEDVGRFNIVGDYVVMWGTIRCLEQNDMAIVQENLRRLAEHQAESFGATATVEYLQDVPPVTNTAAWIRGIAPSITRVVGAGRVAEIPATLGYDDVSVFVKEFGGAYFNYGVQDTRIGGPMGIEPVPGGRGMAMNHNPAFYADDDALLDSLRIHAHVAYDHLLGLAVEKPE